MEEKRKWTFFIRDKKACSINHAYSTKDRRKSKETVDWLFDLKVKILENREAINEIRAIYDKKKHFMVCEYIAFIPKKSFFTTDKRINERSGDTSNFAKIPDDLVFNRVLGIDDSLICKQVVYKLPWDGREYHIKITISIMDMDALEKKALSELPEYIRNGSKLPRLH